MAATGTCVVRGCADVGTRRQWRGRWGPVRAVLCDAHDEQLVDGARFRVIRAVYADADRADVIELVLLSGTGEPPVEADHGHASRL